jgi:hypothetical protein
MNIAWRRRRLNNDFCFCGRQLRAATLFPADFVDAAQPHLRGPAEGRRGRPEAFSSVSVSGQKPSMGLAPKIRGSRRMRIAWAALSSKGTQPDFRTTIGQTRGRSVRSICKHYGVNRRARVSWVGSARSRRECRSCLALDLATEEGVRLVPDGESHEWHRDALSPQVSLHTLARCRSKTQ